MDRWNSLKPSCRNWRWVKGLMSFVCKALVPQIQAFVDWLLMLGIAQLKSTSELNLSWLMYPSLTMTMLPEIELSSIVEVQRGYLFCRWPSGILQSFTWTRHGSFGCWNPSKASEKLNNMLMMYIWSWLFKALHCSDVGWISPTNVRSVACCACASIGESCMSIELALSWYRMANISGCTFAGAESLCSMKIKILILMLSQQSTCRSLAIWAACLRLCTASWWSNMGSDENNI